MFYNEKLLAFLKDTDNEKRIFILGDTASGKSTGVLEHFMKENPHKLIYYITTRKADLSEKRIFILENMKDYAVYFHDKANSVEKTNITGSITKQIHLLTVEKALYLLLSQTDEFGTKYPAFEERSSFDKPDLFILDEIDSLEEDTNYELLTALINRNYSDVKTVYISAVVDENYVKRKLGTFLKLENPDKDCYSLEKKEKKMFRKFIPMGSNLKKEIMKYLKEYANNQMRFRQTIFIIPSIKRITELPSLEEITSLSGFKKNMEKLSEDLKKSDEDISDLEETASKDLKASLKYNFAVMYSGTNSTDRNIILKLFNAGKIQLLVSTNVIERGINVKTNSLLLFETKQVKWNNKQIMNFFGRINREKGSNKDMAGIFLFISSARKNYNFNVIDKRNLTITSALEDYKVAIYSFYFKGFEKYLLKNKNLIESDIKRYSYLKPFADAIKYSVPAEYIKSNYKLMDIFLINPNKEEVSKEKKEEIGNRKREAIKIIMSNIKENVIKENMLKYLYVKSVEKMLENTDDKIIKENLKDIINEAFKIPQHSVLRITQAKRGKAETDEESKLKEIKEGKIPKGSIFFYSNAKEW